MHLHNEFAVGMLNFGDLFDEQLFVLKSAFVGDKGRYHAVTGAFNGSLPLISRKCSRDQLIMGDQTPRIPVYSP